MGAPLLSSILEPTGETYARLTDGERWRISDSLPQSRMGSTDRVYRIEQAVPSAEPAYIPSDYAVKTKRQVYSLMAQR